MAEVTEPQDALDNEREFMEQQRSGIGATDTPKILGLSRYGTARTVYERIISDPGDRAPSSLPAWLGLRIQGVVAELYTQATGYRIRAARQHYRHKEDDWLVCHLDYRVWGAPNILVECKTRSRMSGWGEDGSEDIPKGVWAQCQHEMMVANATECHVAVLFGHHTFRVYRIKRNGEFIDKLRALLKDFWHDNVLKRVPPPFTGHELDRRLLQQEYPENTPFYRNATPAQAEVVGELRACVETLAEADKELEDAKTAVKELIGEELGLIGPFGTVTWKKTKDVVTVDWRRIALAYREELEDWIADESTDDASHLDEIQAEHTKTREGTRRFTMEWSE